LSRDRVRVVGRHRDRGIGFCLRIRGRGANDLGDVRGNLSIRLGGCDRVIFGHGQGAQRQAEGGGGGDNGFLRVHLECSPGSGKRVWEKANRRSSPGWGDEWLAFRGL
jgi:hypothetical protein